MVPKLKHLRSSIADLRNLFTKAIAVDQISSALELCEARADVAVARRLMEEKDFDVVGLEKSGNVYGYVELAALKDGVCSESENVFQPDDLLAAGSPLREALGVLQGKKRLFLREGSKVSQIVTLADLNKAPVRLYFFGVITLLEMQLTRLVGHYYQHDSWRDSISAPRLEAATKFHAARKKQNQELALVECLQFCDKRDILLATQGFVEVSTFRSKDALENVLKNGEKLRDKLAHGNDAVLGSSWPDTIELVNSLELLAERLEEVGN